MKCEYITNGYEVELMREKDSSVSIEPGYGLDSW
jgi:hypothetical protein